MYKAIYEYQKISKSMRLKVSLTLKYDIMMNSKFNNKVIDKFNINGDDYLKLTPFPFLVIDISNKRNNEEWSPNDSVSLSQYGIFVCKKALKQMIKNMHTEDLFIYIDGKLTVDKSIAEDVTIKFPISNKYIMLRPVVIEDDGDEYEGIAFIINSFSNYAMITMDELEYLYDILCITNLSSLALELMTISMGLKSIATRKVEIEKKPITEETSSEEVSSNFSTKPEEPTIPDI